MINRRLLRVKTLQVLYPYFQAGNSDMNKAEKELLFSIQKTFDLYHYLMLLLGDIKDLANKRIELAKQKHLPTPEDLNPNMRFVNNRIINLLMANKSFTDYVDVNKLTWRENTELVTSLLNTIVETEQYKAYMTAEKSNFSDERRFVDFILNQVFMNSEYLFHTLEEQSIYWNDDIDFVISMIGKTIHTFTERSTSLSSLLPMFKSPDDKDFVKTLFRKTILRNKEITELIDKFTENWDIERIAFMDIILLKMAIAEVLEFPSIPTKVTLNEYIEISKFYSTKKSGTFINGVLDKVVASLHKENRFEKAGRGLD